MPSRKLTFVRRKGREFYASKWQCNRFGTDNGRKSIGDILAEPFLSKWIFDVEIIARYLRRYGNDPALVEPMIYEYPLERWEDVAGSKLRSGDFLTAVADVLKIRKKYLR